MKVLNLQCRHGHNFEGWFESAAAFEDQRERGLLSCPLCSDEHVMRVPSAPRLNLSTAKRDDADLKAVEQRVHALWKQAVEHVLSNTEDVGANFAEEVRRIHHGEAEERGIRGQATRDEVAALRDEQIEIFALPVSGRPKETLQ